MIRPITWIGLPFELPHTASVNSVERVLSDLNMDLVVDDLDDPSRQRVVDRYGQVQWSCKARTRVKTVKSGPPWNRRRRKVTFVEVEWSRAGTSLAGIADSMAAAHRQVEQRLESWWGT